MLTLYQVFLETFSVVIPPGVTGPEVGVAAVSEVVEPVVSVVLVVDLEVSEPGVVFVSLVSVADAAEPQASVYIALAFYALVPVSVFADEVDSCGRPRFSAFPNIDYYASPSISFEVVGEESVHSSTGVRTNYGLGSILSNLGRHQNKNLGHCYNKPNPGYNNVSDTNDLPMDATTNHPRKICLHLYQEQSTHCLYQAVLSHPEVPQIRWVGAEKFQYLHLPLPWFE
ncbi:MAG: hypothetical protein RDU01_12105 [Thermodesulfovibrionales bacterium]|nr:hypothetical protein [Thermodesulfovibrionales bacterium]